jgi:hypothetical protein
MPHKAVEFLDWQQQLQTASRFICSTVFDLNSCGFDSRAPVQLFKLENWSTLTQLTNKHSLFGIEFKLSLEMM